MIKSQWRMTSISVFALVVLALFLSGCVDTRYTIRQVDQHPSGEFNTVETSGERVISIPPFYESSEYLGINFWNCLQSGHQLVCEKICDDNWDRICAPSLKREFGQVTRPGAGVVMATYKTRMERPDEPWMPQDDSSQEIEAGAEEDSQDEEASADDGSAADDGGETQAVDEEVTQ